MLPSHTDHSRTVLLKILHKLPFQASEWEPFTAQPFQKKASQCLPATHRLQAGGRRRDLGARSTPAAEDAIKASSVSSARWKQKHRCRNWNLSAHSHASTALLRVSALLKIPSSCGQRTTKLCRCPALWDLGRVSAGQLLGPSWHQQDSQRNPWTRNFLSPETHS